MDVEMLVEIEGFHTIVAQVEGEDAGATFDKTMHKMEHQIHKYKEKHRDHKHKTSIKDVLQQVEEKTDEASAEP